MHVRGDDAGADRDEGGPPQADALAGPRRQARDRIGYTSVAVRCWSLQQAIVVALHAQRDAGECRRGVPECLGARDEVGFRVQFSDRARSPLDDQGHQSFCRHTIDLAGCLRNLGGAQPIDRGLEIAVHLRQRLLAINTPALVLSRSSLTSGADEGHTVPSLVIQIGGHELEQSGGRAMLRDRITFNLPRSWSDRRRERVVTFRPAFAAP